MHCCVFFLSDRALQLLGLNPGDFIAVQNTGFDLEESLKGRSLTNTLTWLLQYEPYKQNAHKKKRFRGRHLLPCNELGLMFYMSNFDCRNVVGQKWMNYVGEDWESRKLVGHKVEVNVTCPGTKEEDKRYSVDVALPLYTPLAVGCEKERGEKNTEMDWVKENGGACSSKIDLTEGPEHVADGPAASGLPDFPENPNGVQRRILALHLVRENGGGQDFSNVASDTQQDIDLGQVGYCAQPQPNIKYLFKLDNPNARFIEPPTVQMSHYKSTIQTAGLQKKDVHRCAGCVECKTESCEWTARPASTALGLYRQCENPCPNCGSPLYLVHCTAEYHRTTTASHHTLEMKGHHTDHKKCNANSVAPTEAALLSINARGAGAKTFTVRTGADIRHPALVDTDRFRRLITAHFEALFPNGTGLESVATFNRTMKQEFVRGKPMLDHISCASDWELEAVKRITEQDEQVYYSTDVTYKHSKDMVKFVFSVFDVDIGLTDIKGV